LFNNLKLSELPPDIGIKEVDVNHTLDETLNLISKIFSNTQRNLEIIASHDWIRHLVENPSIFTLIKKLKYRSIDTKIVVEISKMNVNSSKVDFFDSKFVMITSDAKGFHWHTITNFSGKRDTYFGTDDSIFIDGTVDFFTDDKLVSGNSRVVFMINNFELLQIIFLDNKIADHFHNFPLYGVIDSIEIKN